jgi:hypothetical protein
VRWVPRRADVYVWLALALGAYPVFCFVTYLIFLGFVIVRTGGTSGLRDVAAAIRAFRWPAFWPSKVVEPPPTDEHLPEPVPLTPVPDDDNRQVSA